MSSVRRSAHAPAPEVCPAPVPAPSLDARPRPAPSRRDRRGRPGGRRHHRRRLPGERPPPDRAGGVHGERQAIEQANEQSDRRSRTTRSSPAPAATPTPARLPSRRRTAATGSPRRPPRPGLVRRPRSAPPARRSARPWRQSATPSSPAPRTTPCSGPGAPARVRLGRQPVLLPRQPLGGRERLELPGREPSSGAYGIPQSLPGSKMASVAPTGARTRSPRSRGACSTRAATAAPAVRWAQWQSRSPHWY